MAKSEQVPKFPRVFLCQCQRQWQPARAQGRRQARKIGYGPRRKSAGKITSENEPGNSVPLFRTLKNDPVQLQQQRSVLDPEKTAAVGNPRRRGKSCAMVGSNARHRKRMSFGQDREARLCKLQH